MLILKAAKIVKNYRDDFLVYILGDGEEKNNLINFIESNGLKDNVKILGFKDNPYPYIKNSCATILTSLSEGFSLALAESVVLNTPIISTDVDIAKELVEKFNCGTIVNYDEYELAKSMINYLQSNNIIIDYNASQYFDIENELANTIKVIEDAISKKEKKNTFKKLDYPVEEIDYFALSNYTIKPNLLYVLSIIKDGVKYEYLIDRKNYNDKLIVFNNGAITTGNAKYPIFQRHSWAAELKTSAIFCMDPTMYINDIAVGWGIGKNDNYYLKNSALILKEIINKMNIKLEDTIIYGTSAGGFISIMMGTYLKGTKVVADNSQLDISNWAFIGAVDEAINYCFDNISMALKYPERFNVVDMFLKENYVPQIYLHVNLCSKIDNSMQLVLFLQKIENMKNIKNYNPMNIILHYEEAKGHDGLSKDEALNFIYNLLNI